MLIYIYSFSCLILQPVASLLTAFYLHLATFATQSLDPIVGILMKNRKGLYSSIYYCPNMSQFREQGFQQTSPASYAGIGIDVGNIGSTPGSRAIGFSPGSNSVNSASKPTMTPDRDGSDGKHSIFSPTIQGSGGGFRTTGIPVDRDPFVTPSSKSKVHGQQLSATASAFRPFYDDIPSDDSEENLSHTKEECDNHLSESVSPALSTELLLSRCIEISCSTSVTSADVEAYLAVCCLIVPS